MIDGTAFQRQYAAANAQGCGSSMPLLDKTGPAHHGGLSILSPFENDARPIFFLSALTQNVPLSGAQSACGFDDFLTK